MVILCSTKLSVEKGPSRRRRAAYHRSFPSFYSPDSPFLLILHFVDGIENLAQKEMISQGNVGSLHKTECFSLISRFLKRGMGDIHRCFNRFFDLEELFFKAAPW